MGQGKGSPFRFQGQGKGSHGYWVAAGLGVKKTGPMAGREYWGLVIKAPRHLPLCPVPSPHLSTFLSWTPGTVLNLCFLK